MSDAIGHECGVVLLRLLKPLEYYLGRYGTAFYGLDKLYLLMEKQHNRGQDGAGLGCIKLDVPPGHPYMNRIRSSDANPIQQVFDRILRPIEKIRRQHPDRLRDVHWLKTHLDFTGELFLGHLRYGTYGRNGLAYCHPILRENNWVSKCLMIAGNFNLTNVDELFDSLVNIGQHPRETSDTVTILEKMGHFLDEENEELYQRFKKEGYSKKEISPLIAEHLRLERVLSRASKNWDGGYVVAGLLGHGDAFVLRDPAGIRPVHYYADEEVVVVASERPAIQTAFNLPVEAIRELGPGHALLIRRNGRLEESLCQTPLRKAACSFERIYFSRGTDAAIYQERKQLGNRLAAPILKAIDHDLENTIFSYIPNTAIAAFKGMIEGLNAFCDQQKKERILQLDMPPDPKRLEEILALRPRVEQIAVKDAKLRTFITEDARRDDLVTHVYDVTYGVVRPGLDTLVVVDDSIVRGTTLRQSIIRILNRLKPKRIVIVSSAPQIRYPDCYGIDMTRLGEFIAFRAALELLRETGRESTINEVYRRCKEQDALPAGQTDNCVREIYRPFCPQEISDRIAQMLCPPDMEAGLQLVYQGIEDLHAACPGHAGDWYFTGDYPTPGGNKVANRSFIHYIEGKNQRAY